MNPLMNSVGSNAEGKLDCINAVVITQRITVILIQQDGGYFIPKIRILGIFRERNSLIDYLSLFQIVKRQVIVKMLV